MSTTRFRSALASSCTSAAVLLAADAWASASSAPASTPAISRVAELEAQLAKDAAIYLVLEPAESRVEIKSRGVVLDHVKLEGMALLSFRPLFGGATTPPPAAPAIWKVTQGPGDSDRETIAPVELKPYSSEEAKEEPAPAPAKPGAAPAAAPEAKKPKQTTWQATYRIELDNGWQLFVVNQMPRQGFFRRFVDAVNDGLLRLRGEEPRHPPLITIVVAPADAQRLHHLFRTGTPILVTATDHGT